MLIPFNKLPPKHYIKHLCFLLLALACTQFNQCKIERVVDEPTFKTTQNIDTLCKWYIKGSTKRPKLLLRGLTYSLLM